MSSSGNRTMANPMVTQALDLVYRIILTVFRQLQNMPYNGINVTLLIVILRRMTLTTLRKLWKVRTPLLFLGGWVQQIPHGKYKRIHAECTKEEWKSETKMCNLSHSMKNEHYPISLTGTKTRVASNSANGKIDDAGKLLITSVSRRLTRP
jgi:hypothetical protein